MHQPRMAMTAPLCLAACLVCSVLVLGCDTTVPVETEPAEQQADIRPGTILLSPLAAVHQTNAAEGSHFQSASTDTLEFDLGEINNTTHFYFVLANGGDTDIREVALTLHDSAFVVSPSRVPLLRPFDNVGLHQVIRVTAIHGSAVSGVGHGPVMKPGVNTSALRVAGLTADGEGVEMEVSLDARLSVSALLVDFEIDHGGGRLDVARPWGVVMNARAAPFWIPLYRVSGPHVTVENTGNVQVHVTAHVYKYPQFAELASQALPPARQIELPIHAGETLFLKVDGHNTIVNSERLTIQQDGMIHVAVTTMNLDPPPDVDGFSFRRAPVSP